MRTTRRLSAFATMLALAACSSPAVLDDVARGAKHSCYTIRAVDGQKPVRRQGTIVTYVPFVLVPAGRHVLRLERDAEALLNQNERDLKLPEFVDLTVHVAAGRRYYLRMTGPEVELVPDL